MAVERAKKRKIEETPNTTAQPSIDHYHRCQWKMDLYREGIGYGSLSWKKRTTHQRPREDRGDNEAFSYLTRLALSNLGVQIFEPHTN